MRPFIYVQRSGMTKTVVKSQVCVKCQTVAQHHIQKHTYLSLKCVCSKRIKADCSAVLEAFVKSDFCFAVFATFNTDCEVSESPESCTGCTQLVSAVSITDRCVVTR